MFALGRRLCTLLPKTRSVIWRISGGKNMNTASVCATALAPDLPLSTRRAAFEKLFMSAYGSQKDALLALLVLARSENPVCYFARDPRGELIPSAWLLELERMYAVGKK
jgi:hypothetical protein